GEAWFVHCPEERELTQQIVEIFKPLFENQTIGKIGQNIKYDMEVLLNYGVEVVGELYDTMIAHYLLQPDMRHNMDILAENYLNYHPVSIETLIGKKGKSQRSMRTVERSKLKDYACEDADITLRLWHIFKEELEQHQLMELFTSIEMPLVRVLCEMERNGVKLDIKALNEYSSLLTDEILSIKKEIFEYAGTEFNISSPKQLGEILFERLKISDKPKRTKTKQYSTGEDVLLKLKDNHPIVEAILTYRSLTKLKSTYVDALPALINSKTGMVHTSYNQTVAATGRLSSNNPNLQNIPIRTSKGREIRKAFIPRAPDNVMMAADYSQIELRIIAHLSGDEVMKKAFSDGQDIHTATASKVFDVPLDAVTEDMRRKAKMVNFGIAYGISAFGLSERLNISRGEAADIIEAYFRQYPEIKRYMDRTIQQARKNGYVETIKQRRRYLRDINSSNNTVKQFAERNAINAPIQGSSADMIKIAMISIYREMKRQKMKSKMIMQVHDELVFNVVHDELEKIKKITMEGMQNAIPLSVPIKVDIKTGKNWLEAH
ncbi:MAG: DNA polymerase I, partial [Bacteroidales bacterium]|nr:DNA polymerase I [Bacteroidales bacterium]